MTSHSAGIAAVIPCLDAQDTIAEVVRATRRHIDRVVVVDDGSGDLSAQRAAGAGAELLRHGTTRGKGAALRSGFSHLLGRRPGEPPDPAGGPAPDAIVTLDADGQHDPDDIPALQLAFRRHRPAIVIGSRARHFDAMLGRRRAMNRFSVAALRFFAGLELPDSQSGFRLYDAAFLAASVTSGARYEAEMEALLAAARRRLPIVSVPIGLKVVDGQATSHFRTFPDTFRIIGVVLGDWLRGGPRADA